MRTIIWYLNFARTLIGKSFAGLKYKKLRLILEEEEFNRQVEQITSDFAMSNIKMSGAKVHITGLDHVPKDEAVLFVANHQSNFDIAVLMAYIRKPKGYIAKTELLKVPVMSTWMKHMNCVFMDRSDIKSAAGSIIEGIQLLKSGYSLVVFPEGTRSRNGKLLEFKAGSFKLATKSKRCIIPISIRGTRNLMEANNNKIKPADVFITIHPPVSTIELTKEQQNELPEKIKSIIQSAL